MPTDPIANDLAIRLFLFGAALMSLFEGIKLHRPYSLGAWLAAALFFLCGILLTPLTGLFPIARGWLGSLAANPLTWFILVVLAYLLVRPQIARRDTLPAGSSAYDDKPIRGELARIEQTNRATISDYQNVLGKLESLRERVDEQRGWIQGVESDFKKRLLRIDYSISAIGHNDVLLQRASKIEEEARGLDMEACGGSLDTQSAWSAWENRHARWKSLLEDWLLYSGPYWNGLRETVYHVPEHIFDSHWNVEDCQFPGSTAVMKYKKFCVIQTNWGNLKDRVHAQVRRVAFEGVLPNGAAAE